MKKEIILWGGTGQAKVVRPIIEYYGSKIIAIIDDTPGLKSPFEDIPIYGGKTGFFNFIKTKKNEDIGFVVTIGNAKNIRNAVARKEISKFLINERLTPENIIHHTAYIDKNVNIGKGVQIMANAKIITETKISDYCIINTGASIDHECILDDCVEVDPQATLCGCIHVGENSWIAANATVLPKIKIGKNSVVGAGAVVTKDVPDNTIVVGNPARVFHKKI